MDPFTWRFMVRSKDRLFGTPASFTSQLPNQIPDDCDSVWVRLACVSLGTYPSPSDAITTSSASYSLGGSSVQPNIPTASATANPYSLNTNSCVDVCMSFGTLNTLDSELAKPNNSYITSASINAGSTITSLSVPVADKSRIFASGATSTAPGDLLTIGGFTGTVVGFGAGTVLIQFGSAQTTPFFAAGTAFVVTPAQACKTLSDKTIALVPFSRGDGERLLRLYTEPAWVKLNSTNFGNFQVKLFDDQGSALKLKKLYATSTQADLLDVNISDWSFELQVKTGSSLPESVARRLI